VVYFILQHEILQNYCNYYRSKGANSVLVPLQIYKSYCLPFILYETKAVPLTKSSVKVLDGCIQRAVSKIFKVNDRDNIAIIGHNFDLPHIGSD